MECALHLGSTTNAMSANEEPAFLVLQLTEVQRRDALVYTHSLGLCDLCANLTRRLTSEKRLTNSALYHIVLSKVLLLLGLEI